MTKRSWIRGGAFVFVASASALAVGCGGGSDQPQTYAEAKARIDSPTGTVDTATAPAVAEAFEESMSSGVAGIREKAAAQSATINCPGGGSASVSSSGDQNSGTARYTYSNCSYEAGCTINGTGAIFYNGGLTDYCMSYDLDMACAESSASLNYSGCISNGTFAYSVTVEDETFTVTGSYAAGNGTLSITGANGSYECTYTNYSGTCTGSDGSSFEFTGSAE